MVRFKDFLFDLMLLGLSYLISRITYDPNFQQTACKLVLGTTNRLITMRNM